MSKHDPERVELFALELEREWPEVSAMLSAYAALLRGDSAAPDLLAALIALVERGTDSPDHIAAEAAIAKAAGRARR